MNAAQAMGLHQESTWGALDFVERQIRRHVWWTVFTGATYVSWNHILGCHIANQSDRYVALTHGKSSRINEELCDVKASDDLERDLIPPTEFDSLERRDDGQMRSITLYSYVRYRNKIYTIAESLSRDMDLARTCHPQLLIQHTRRLHELLLSWEKSVPPELRLETYSGRSLDEPNLRKFAMQVMAL